MGAPIKTGEKIRLESANYLLRTMEPGDAVLDWGGWMANPTTARQLNAVPRALNTSEREAYVAKFDSKVRHLLGIWEKSSGQLVGLWEILVDEATSEYLVNIMIGVSEARAKGAQRETCELIYQHFFDRLGMKAVRCTVSERNDKMIQYLMRRRWTHVTSVQKAAATGSRPVMIHLFRLSCEDWRARSVEGWREDDSRKFG